MELHLQTPQPAEEVSAAAAAVYTATRAACLRGGLSSLLLPARREISILEEYVTTHALFRPTFAPTR